MPEPSPSQRPPASVCLTFEVAGMPFVRIAARGSAPRRRHLRPSHWPRFREQGAESDLHVIENEHPLTPASLVLVAQIRPAHISQFLVSLSRCHMFFNVWARINFQLRAPFALNVGNEGLEVWLYD